MSSRKISRTNCHRCVSANTLLSLLQKKSVDEEGIYYNFDDDHESEDQVDEEVCDNSNEVMMMKTMHTLY